MMASGKVPDAPRWTCARCGRSYKTATTFLRHKCAVTIRQQFEDAIESEDRETLRDLLEDAFADEASDGLR